ncbi:uncharacterized protein LOC126819640 isoform X2 [Patella vulgata]|uniref:uncharacterized protein LOC126819640 isoform X2 n=1 Tax=Patella vulgata TaxID=6465 RepID=UPI0024A9A2C2|nr:uncharacterized protein LOC126819640 isoform X2 [Patella vulgata]
MRCAGKLQTCSSLVSAIPLSSPPSALCPKAREAIACVREMASTCSNVVPPQSLLDFQRATQPFQQLCDGDGLTDTSLASNSILSPSECGSMVQECGSMVNQIDFSDMQETCSGLRGMVQCMENVGDSCGDLFPQIEGQLNKTRDQIKSVCGNVATDTGVTINPVVIECKDKLKTCNAILADVPSQTSTDVMCPHAKKLTSCVDQLFSQCSKIVPVQTLMKFELSIEPFVKMCENPATTQLPVTEYVETSTVITLDKKPSVTLQDCGNKIQKCMTMFNSFSFENGKKSMCMDLKKMLECNENTVFQCRNVVPAGVQAQIEGQLKKAKDNFEFTCPGNNKGRFPPAKCEALISKCKRKLVGYEAGNKEKCLQGYKTMRCYRRVAKVCKLARPIRKEIKAFKKSHINTCGKKKPRDVDDVYDLDDSYIAWLDSDNIDAD